MCGIHVVVDEIPKPEALAGMVAAVPYRGPDAAGIQEVILENHWLGMAANRLRISDQSTGSDQPFADDKESWLVFNGELYNAFELRNELLGQGVGNFQSASDTEVLSKALALWGARVLPRLNGMFALAYWHGPTGRLLLARDSKGMKPLYAATTSQGRIFSSSVQALLQSKLIPEEPDANEIAHLLAHRYPKGSGLVGVTPVKPGTYISWNQMDGWQETPFVTAVAGPTSSVALKEVLTDALLRHGEASVRVGMFLSGGIDSTLLLALYHAEGIPRPPAFSVAWRPKDQKSATRDMVFAEKAAKQYGTSFIPKMVGPEDLLRDFDAYIKAMETPIGDSGGFLTWQLSKVAKEAGMGVVLSGAGADELFAGYNRHRAFHKCLRNPKRYRVLTPIARGISRALLLSPVSQMKRYGQLLHKLGRSLDKDPGVTFAKFSGLELPLSYSEFWDSYSDQAGDDPLEWALEQDLTQYLVKDVLAISDVNSMAHSLEMRLPYLDAEVVAWAKSKPPSEHLAQGQKSLLKELLKDLGGSVYVQRPKEGFGLPLGLWIRNDEIADWLAPLYQDDLSIWEHIDPAIGKTWVQAHKAGRGDYTQELWNLVVLAAWWQQHMR